ncbi:MAG: CRISPR-associated endonuclease Cas2 [Fuerstiella sp.]
MPRSELVSSGYLEMWLFAMFDLPVKTKEEKRAYTRFRTLLLKEGFSKMQFSIYARFCGSEEVAETHRERLRRVLPKDGHIRLLAVTDRQFGKMEVFYGRKRGKTESKPDQLQLF